MANVLRGPQNVSAAEFAQALSQSGLLDSAVVDPGSAPDGLAAARHLVEAYRAGPIDLAGTSGSGTRHGPGG